MIAFDCSLQQNLSDHVNPIKEGEVVFKHHSFPKKLSQKGLHMDGIMHFQAISVHDGHMWGLDKCVRLFLLDFEHTDDLKKCNYFISVSQQEKAVVCLRKHIFCKRH